MSRSSSEPPAESTADAPHAPPRDRHRERYDHDATRNTVRAPEAAIRSGEAMRLTSEPGSAASYLVRLSPGCVVRALYDEADGRLVTFLPLRRNRRRRAEAKRRNKRARRGRPAEDRETL
jgi:hypothetical protein